MGYLDQAVKLSLRANFAPYTVLYFITAHVYVCFFDPTQSPRGGHVGISMCVARRAVGESHLKSLLICARSTDGTRNILYEESVYTDERPAIHARAERTQLEATGIYSFYTR